MSTTSTLSNINTNTNEAPSFSSLVGGSGTVYSDPFGARAEWVRKVNTNHIDAPFLVVGARSKDGPAKLTDVQAASIEELRAYPSADPVIPELLDPVLTSPEFDDVRTLLEDRTVILSKREVWSVTGRILDRKRNPNDRRLGRWVRQYRRGRRLPDEEGGSEVESVGGSEEDEIDVSDDSSGNDSGIIEGTVEGYDRRESEIHDRRDIAESIGENTKGSRHTRFNKELDVTPCTGATPQAAWQCR
jgi:hypothetical protein